MFKPNLILIFLLFFLQQTWAQVDRVAEKVEEKYIPATTYLTRDGLPSNNIQDIVQDENGFLWLATQEGLSRFDSVKFSNFTKDKSDSYSLPDILIEDLILMPNGLLLMSIYEVGITVFDQFSKKSESAKNNQSSLFQLPNSHLYGIDKDVNNNIWFSLYGEGIYQWNWRESRFYKHLSTDENAWLSSKQTFEILIDVQNRLWVCTIDSKVFRYDINTGTSQYFDFSTDINDPLSSPIYGFAESKQGEIYAGGYAGVFKYDELQQTFDHIIDKELISSIYHGDSTSVRRLMVDSHNNLWIGTSNSLLQYANQTLKQVKLYENGSVIEDNWLSHAIVETSDGNIWIGTEGRGLIKISSDWERFNVYLSASGELIDYRTAYQFEDNIWLVHTSSQIDLFNYTDNQLQLKSSLRPNLGLNKIRIEALYQDEPDFLWISTIDGIHKVDTTTGESQHVTDAQGRKLGTVGSFIRTSDGKFYFFLFAESQLGYFEPQEMLAHLFENSEDNRFKGTTVNQMSIGIDGKIWLASDYGIETFDLQTQQFDVVYTAINKQIISGFYPEKNHQSVWMIADGGLYQLLWDGKKLTPSDNNYSNILPKLIFDKIKLLDNDVMLITTEDHGLIELNAKTLDYVVFTDDNGLPSNVVKEVLFAQQTPLVVTDLGVAVYNKAFTQPPSKPPEIIIDTVKLSGEKISSKTQQQLVFEHDFGSLDFDVVLLSYLNSASIEYEYKLAGLNNKWINTGNDNKFSFLNLAAGDYNFHIRGRSNFGQWSNIQHFAFKVKTPPWQTLWAYGLYSLLVLGVILWLMYLYKRKILYEHEITKQQTQKKIANAASKAKSDFLARVSHEIRTPLNGVLGMGELMLDTNMDEEQKIYAESIMTSGQHLLEIINDILDLSKIEAGKLELEYKSLDLLLLVDELVSVFTSQCQQKKLLFTCLFNDNINRYRLGDAIRIKQILFNLLSNAFKFTQQGEIILSVSQAKDCSDTIIFKVTDTGIGINNDYVEELFQPFVQADTAITRKYGGTGLGLAIVKQLVEKMQGTIAARARNYHGSIFTATIQLKNQTMPAADCSTSSPQHVSLIIQQKNLKHSLQAYLNLLKISHSETVTAQTTSVFIEALTSLNDNQIKSLEQVASTNMIVNFIGFNTDNLDKKLLKKINFYKTISPPITFKKLQKMFCENSQLETQKQPQHTLLNKQFCLNLLVVEDNLINQQVSLEMLEKLGHRVDVVDNAEQALEQLKRNNHNNYDVLLLDYHLPKMDGLELIKHWDNHQDIPVIMMTADLTDDVLQKCHKLNIEIIVAKPFTQLDLSKAITKALQQKL